MSFEAKHLHVIAIVHNPLRFASRDQLFREFRERMRNAGVTLHVVEAAFGERDHTHLVPNDGHIMLSHDHELWMKESMINVGFSRLPPDWKYAAWIDGDVAFMRPDWAVETIHQLQHYRVVQLFQTAADLGPTGEIMQTFNGFGYSKAAGLPEWISGTTPPKLNPAGYYYEASLTPGRSEQGKFWHPGFAWAIRRETFDELGGLIDWSVLGSADHMMALAMIGKVEKAVPTNMNPNYLKHAKIWQERAHEHVRGDIGFVTGTILHHWHGRKRDRRYVERWEILRRHNFDPERDIRKDHQGLVHLTRPGERMRDDLRTYFRQRNEDSIDND